VLRRRRPEIDPLAHVRPADVPPRWRGAVEAAVDHRRRFGEVRDLVAAGPLRDRIASLGDRVDAGVLAVWDLVQRAVVAERVLQTIEPGAAMDRLKDARRRLAAAEAAGGDTAELRRDVELHAGRHAAAQRVWNEVEDLGSRLGALDARLGVVVAHAAELAAGAGQAGTLDVAVADLDAAIDQLAATRAALAELEAE
jgi:hypothetical protein